MKRRFSAFAALIAILSLTLMMSGCGETTVAFDSVLPWNMPSLYEYSEFSVSTYLMDGDARLETLASGSMTLTLQNGENMGESRLDMSAILSYNNSETNGADKGMTDTARSTVIFDSLSLLPKESEKTVTLQKRADKADNSYTARVSYADKKAVLTLGGETKEKNLKLSGQVFDNEQLYYILRALPTVSSAGSSQVFRMCQPLDAINYGIDVYAMLLRVSAEVKTITLDGWKNSSTYGMTLSEDVPSVSCYEAEISISENNPGPSIYAYYSSEPMKITENISTFKPLVGIKVVAYSSDYSKKYNTVYTLTDYKAVTR